MRALGDVDRRFAGAVAAAVLLALALRLAMVVATPGLELAADPADYVRHAESIAAGEGYPATVVAGRGGTALRPPGFPYFLGLVWAVTGGDHAGARVAQALVGTALAAMTGLLAAMLLGRRTGLVALVLAALYPPLIVGGTALVSEPLFTVLELAAVVALLRHLRSRAIAWAAVAGILGGLAVLTRPNGTLLVIVLAAVAGTSGSRAGGRRWRPAAAAVLLLAAGLTILPWTVRNAIVLGEFVPVSTNGGYTLAGTYNDTSREDPTFPAAWRPANLDPAYRELLGRAPAMTEPEVNAMLGEAARDYIADHPAYVAEAGARNLLRLFSAGGQDFHRLATAAEVGLGAGWSDVSQYGFAVFALLALAGAATLAARRIPRWLWLVPSSMATVVVVLASQRFRTPIDPFVILLAAAAVTAWKRPAR